MAQTPSSRSRLNPPATAFPTLDNLKLPRPLVDGVTRGYQLIYSVRDQATANTDAINHMTLYGTMQQRLEMSPTSLPDGALWFVTDYPDAVYQVRVDPKMNQLAWFYATGVVWKVPTTPPAGFQLGLNDAGYMLVTATALLVWDGTQNHTFL